MQCNDPIPAIQHDSEINSKLSLGKCGNQRKMGIQKQHKGRKWEAGATLD